MLSDDARAQIEANKGRGRRWLEGDPVELVDRTPRRIVTLAMVEPGVEVWASDGGRRDHHLEPLGGLVVAVHPGASHVDADTGEIVEQPARYTCYDPLVSPVGRAFRTLDQGEIDVDKITVPDAYELGHAVRRFARGVCGHDRRNPPGNLTHFEADLVLWAANLTRALMLGR